MDTKKLKSNTKSNYSNKIKSKRNKELKSNNLKKISKKEKENEMLFIVANKILTKHERAFKELA